MPSPDENANGESSWVTQRSLAILVLRAEPCRQLLPEEFTLDLPDCLMGHQRQLHKRRDRRVCQRESVLRSLSTSSSELQCDRLHYIYRCDASILL